MGRIPSWAVAWFMWAWASVGLLSWFEPAAAETRPSAWVMVSVTGTILLDGNPAPLLKPFTKGQLVAAEKSQAVLFRDGDAEVLRLQGPGAWAVASLGTPTQGGAVKAEGLPVEWRGFRINLDGAAQASLVMRQAQQGRARLRVTAPSGLLLPGEAPVIRWADDPRHGPFRVTIADWQGNRLSAGEAMGNEWRPELEGPLVPGTRYRFSVFSSAHDGRTGESDFGEFRVMTVAAAAELLRFKPEASAPDYVKRLYALKLREQQLFQAAEEAEAAAK
jgi:hypothetical protein